MKKGKKVRPKRVRRLRTKRCGCSEQRKHWMEDASLEARAILQQLSLTNVHGVA